MTTLKAQSTSTEAIEPANDSSLAPSPSPLNSAKILVINGGSSSIRFGQYTRQSANEKLIETASGKIERLAQPGSQLSCTLADGEQKKIAVDQHASVDQAVQFLIDWLDQQGLMQDVTGVGHRLVHGLAHTQSQPITDSLLDDLQQLSRYIPNHLPLQLSIIRQFQTHWRGVRQYVCFDTAFHQTMPDVAKRLPLPRSLSAKGIRRYGFHGLSCHYLMQTLARVGEPGESLGRIVLAHLGNGSSMTAVKNGVSQDNSMGFTPESGLVMSTRCGDLDPGLIGYLQRSEGISMEAYELLISRQSGLLGISETSSDVRDLLAAESSDIRAAEALSTYCYQASKFLGAYTAVLGGLDTLVFAGGIGENAPPIRERICQRMDYLGVELDLQANSDNASIISTPSSRVRVRVIPTDEEQVMAEIVAGLAAGHAGQSASTSA